MLEANYSIDQIRKSIKGYEELCNAFYKMCEDEKTKQEMENILINGVVGDHLLATGLANKDNPSLEGERRISMAKLLLSNPETYKYFKDNNISLFHGTNANALPSIVTYGLKSHYKSEELGLNVNTGETSTRMVNKRKFVSFADILDLAEDYATLSPTNSIDNLNFPILFGITTEDAKKNKVVTISSDICEIGVMNELPPEDLKVVCVPSEHLEFVKKLVRGRIEVLPIDYFGRYFYYIDDFIPMNIDYKKMYELKEKQKQERRKFSFDEFKKLSFTRTIAKIKKVMAEKTMEDYYGKRGY